MFGIIAPFATFHIAGINEFAPFAVATFLLVAGITTAIRSKRCGTIADIARAFDPNKESHPMHLPNGRPMIRSPTNKRIDTCPNYMIKKTNAQNKRPNG